MPRVARTAIAVPLLVPEGGDAAETIWAFRALPVLGYHVHPSHAETIGQALDTLDPSACRAGRVNTVYASEGQLVGAWLDSTAEQVALWTGRHVSAGTTR